RQFCFSSRRRHTRFSRDWSSDVCSSDLRQIQYKCRKYGIEFIEADKWYPSSKMCSCCGSIKKDLKLSDRIFNCSCGHKMDRDLRSEERRVGKECRSSRTQHKSEEIW